MSVKHVDVGSIPSFPQTTKETLMSEEKWKINYENDTGARDDCFVEWWEVYNSPHVFKTYDEDSAKWLCDKLNNNRL